MSRPRDCAGIKSSLERSLRKCEALEAQGESPFVLTATYGLTSTLSFYLPGPARDLLPELELRHDAAPVNQHDLWHPNPRHDPEVLQESAGRRRGRLQHAAQLCLAHDIARAFSASWNRPNAWSCASAA